MHLRSTRFLYLFYRFSMLAAIHLFISSHDEIRISARWIKNRSPLRAACAYCCNCICICTRCNGRHCVSCRHICRSYNLQPHQQRCAYTISPSHITPIIIYQFTTPPTTMCLYNIFTIPHTYLRRYTFLSHLTTKSKISVRWIKLCVGM